MSSFGKFFNLWNKFPLYPSFNLISSRLKVESVANRCRKSFFLIVFTLKLFFVAYMNWGSDEVDSQLNRYSSVYVVWIAFYFILNFYLSKKNLEKNLSDLYFLCGKISRKRPIGEKTLQITVLNLVAQIFFYVFVILSEILLLFRGDSIPIWYDYPVVYSCRVFDIIFLMFYFYMTLIQLELMKSFSYFNLEADGIENIKDACIFWSRLKSNCIEFSETFSGSILNRFGFSALCILMDIFLNVEFYYISEDSYITLALVMLCVSDFLLQVFVVLSFIRVGEALAQEVSKRMYS